MNKRVLFLILILLAVGSLALGTLIGPAGLGNMHLIYMIRLPRVLAAFIVGAGLSISGLTMQSILKNDLASAYTLGVASGANVGVALAFILGLGLVWFPLGAMFFGIVTVMLAIRLAQGNKPYLNTQSLILVGIIISIFASALVMFLAHLSPNHFTRLMLWQFGSFSMMTWGRVGVLASALILIFSVLFYYGKEMDIFVFGNEQAKVLGIDVQKVKNRLLTSATIVTSIGVAFTGVIGFVDLIVPHAMRRLFGTKHRYLLIASALSGGTFMVIVDLVARTILAPSEIPVGIVTALIGAPFFGYLFVKRKDQHAES